MGKTPGFVAARHECAFVFLSHLGTGPYPVLNADLMHSTLDCVEIECKPIYYCRSEKSGQNVDRSLNLERLGSFFEYSRETPEIVSTALSHFVKLYRAVQDQLRELDVTLKPWRLVGQLNATPLPELIQSFGET